WTSIWWLVTGGTLDGRGVRDERHRMSRAEALAAYTRDAAWFAGEQGRRGPRGPGDDADLCVPAPDPVGCAGHGPAQSRTGPTGMGGRVTHEALTSQHHGGSA